jgi:caffeoyl-CoA O-methyltransferase
MSPKTLPLTDGLHAYVAAHGAPTDEVTRALVEETRAVLPEHAGMQVAPEQAGLLTLLAKLVGTRLAVEVGTFTGLSALAIARGLADDGRLICFDISTEYTDIARRYWERAGVAGKIDLRIGPAAERLTELGPEPVTDLAFIDADKSNYPLYWAEIVPRMRPGGVIVIDNVLRGGRVLAPASPDDRTIAEFNDAVRADPRVDSVLLPIADGITVARKR